MYLAEKYKNRMSGYIKIQVVKRCSIFIFFCDEIIISSFALCDEACVRLCFLSVNCPGIKTDSTMVLLSHAALDSA